MLQFTTKLKLFTLFLFIFIYIPTLYAVQIELIPNQYTKINGDGDITTCHEGDIFRLRNSKMYKNQPFDVLLTILEDGNDYDTTSSARYRQGQLGGTPKPCIGIDEHGRIGLRIRDGYDINDIDDNDTVAYMDIKLTIVEKDTEEEMVVDQIRYSAYDLDMEEWNGVQLASSDDIYLTSPSIGRVDANASKVQLFQGSYFDGRYDLKIEGIRDPLVKPYPDVTSGGICIDEPGDPDLTCRASAVLAASSSFTFRVANDNANSGDTGNDQANNTMREFFIILNSGGFIGLGVDHGDLPLSYGDARHDINLSYMLGQNPADSEIERYSDDADADDNSGQDDEEAVSIVGVISTGSEFNMTKGYRYDFNITTSGGAGGYLKAWMDFDADGTFDDFEEIINEETIAQDGIIYHIISVTIPFSAQTGKTYVRFRYAKDDNISASGNGGIGEVEDYVVNIMDSGTVIGTVYDDKNGNGVQDANESGFPNVTVTVIAENGEEQTVITDASGGYSADGVAVGNSVVEIISGLPEGAEATGGTSNPTSVPVTADVNSTETKHGYQLHANLVTAKTVDNTTPKEGETLVYTLNVGNSGPSQATLVSLTDQLPVGLSYVSHTGGDYDANTGLWNIGTIAKDENKTLFITATVNAGTTATTITNIVSPASTPEQNDSISDGDDLEESVTVGDNPVFSVTDVTVIEGEVLLFEVKLSSVSLFPTVITLSTTNDGAVKPQDYTNPDPITVTIEANSASLQVQVPIQSTQDTIHENIETFTLTATVTSGNTANTDANGTGTITDDDPVPTVESVLSDTVQEGETLRHSVTMSNPSANVETYNFNIIDINTSKEDDYEAPTFSVSGVTYDARTNMITVEENITRFDILVLTRIDEDYEDPETYSLSVGGKDATGTITDQGLRPILNRDITGTNHDTNVSLNIISNDTNVEANTVSLHGLVGTMTIPLDTDGDGDIDKIIVENSGTWIVDEAGNITFDPLPTLLPGFSGAIDYTVNGYRETSARVEVLIRNP